MKKNQHPIHKIKIYFVLFFLLCFSTVQIKASGTYTLTNNDVTIKYGVITACSNTNNATHLIIPDSLQNQEVTEIEEKIFENMRIAQITLPSPKAKNFLQWKSGDNKIYSSGDIVNNILTSYKADYNPNMPYTLQDKDVRINGRGDLYMCTYIFSSKILIFPDSLQNIEIKDITADFSEKGITYLKLPNTIELIDDYIFVDNEIETLTIPDNYIKMGVAVFNGNKINQINGLPSNGIIYAKKTDGTNDSTRIISYGGASKTVDFIPDQVKYIFPESFDLCEIKSLTLPNELTFMGEFALSDNKFTSLVFPGNAEWIDQNGKTYAAGSSFTDFKVAYTLNISHTLTDADVTVKESQIIDFKNTHKASFITIPDSLHKQPIIGVREGVFANKGIVKVELPQHKNMSDFRGWISFDAKNISLQNGEYAINNFIEYDILKYYFHKTFIAKLPAYTLTSMDVQMKNETMESCKFHYMVNQRVDYSLDPPQDYYDTLDLSGKLIIPDTLDGQAVKHFKKAIFNEYGIKKLKLPSTLCTIAIAAFAYNEIDSLIIPANVTAIEGGAFKNYWKSIKDGISYLEFENGSRLKKIGTYAFCENHNLDQFLYLPDSLETIEHGAFRNSGVDYINFPKTIKTIDGEAFAGCDIRGDDYLIWPEKCEIEFIGEGAFADNLRIELDGGFILPTPSKSGFLGWKDTVDGSILQGGIRTSNLATSYLAQYEHTLNDDDVDMENNYIKSYYGFYDTASSFIIIPDTLEGQVVKGINENYKKTGIAMGIFYKRHLREIILPSQLEYIPDGCFKSNFLEKIDFPQKVVHIGYSAFHNNKLNSITLPNHTTNGFVGWIAHNKKTNKDSLLTKINDKYIASELFNTSYDAAYEVIFKDHNGHETTDTVKHFKDATPPAGPKRSGYTFTGWDKDYTNITKGITLVAQYAKNGVNNFNVVFKNWDGKILSTQTIIEGNNAIAPDNPERNGYVFLKWDTDFTNVTTDIIVTAEYDIATSINKTPKDGIILYPNPIENGILNIKTQTNIKTISIFDMAGNKVFSKSNPGLKCNIGNLPKGIYLIKADDFINKITIK